jgi:hypothetical protein
LGKAASEKALEKLVVDDSQLFVGSYLLNYLFDSEDIAMILLPGSNGPSPTHLEQIKLNLQSKEENPGPSSDSQITSRYQPVILDKSAKSYMTRTIRGILFHCMDIHIHFK